MLNIAWRQQVAHRQADIIASNLLTIDDITMLEDGRADHFKILNTDSKSSDYRTETMIHGQIIISSDVFIKHKLLWFDIYNY